MKSDIYLADCPTFTSLYDLGKHHKTGRAFDQRTDRGTVASPLDQVCFSVAWDEAVLDLWMADMDALHVLDLEAPIITSTARLAHLVVVGEDKRSAPV